TSRPRFDLEVYRMGWYGGAGARLLLTVQALPGLNQPVPTPQPDTGLLAATWQPAYTLQPAPDWVSGVYLVKLIASDGSVGYLLFVLRDDSSPAPLLYQVPLTTYQAYNKWGGKSLYDYQSPGGRAFKVSFDRPYDNWSGAGLFFEGDYNMIRWLEAQGYPLSYATSLELHANPTLLAGRKAFLSVWHDEYWSQPMRAQLEAARERGVHLAFFNANNLYWQVRFEPNAQGVPDRVLVCYKDAALDPLSASQPERTTVLWRDPPVNRPENALLGVMFESLFDYGQSYPWVVSNAAHWLYAGTGLQNGQPIAGLVGYEYDRVWANGLTPAGLVVVGASPVVDVDGVRSTAQGVIYQAGSGAVVFAAGTNYWAWKMDDNEYQQRGADARVQRMTANLLTVLLGGSAGAATATPTGTTTGTPPVTAAATLTATAALTPGGTATATLTASATPSATPTSTPTSTPTATATLVATATSIPSRTPTPPTLLPCDINRDGRVDIFDYVVLVQNFGKREPGNAADCNGDGRVDIFDYVLLVQNFGRRAP
ncbi:MAG TPA: N,N-dimethylformamidase beta subunit family domain-containing protein, partial [Chloroflexota bacterium]|nr:N,N-dimethylformamidase beta subunit family domain-containing protein [Chloroflexota bacterium]